MTRNIGTPRARWQKGNPMRDHDHLPAPLRHFMIHAPLPWSSQSALRLWRHELQRGGTVDSALHRLRRAARATLARDTTEVWGPDHPSLDQGPLLPPAAGPSLAP